MSERLLLLFMEKLRSSAVGSARDQILVCDVEYAIDAIEESLAQRGINPAILKDES